MKFPTSHAKLAALTLLGIVVAFSLAQAEPKSKFSPSMGQPGKDVIWVPSRQVLVDRMLDMAKVGPDDFVIDLGSGDGRTVISAAKRGAKALGVEFNRNMVMFARDKAKEAGVEFATFVEGDLFRADLSQATVITMFLMPDINLRLRSKLLGLKAGTRVVSNTFDMGAWRADQTVQLEGKCPIYCRAFLWYVPAKTQGTWKLNDGELVLRQTYQKVAGTLRTGGSRTAIKNGKIEGAQISFNAGDKQYTGRVEGDTIEGDGWRATR
jgi:SAM-dependent methyltransferase